MNTSLYGSYLYRSDASHQGNILREHRGDSSSPVPYPRGVVDANVVRSSTSRTP